MRARVFWLTGNSRVRLRSEGPAAAASETSDAAAGAGRRADPVRVAVLRGRRSFSIGRHVETARAT